MVNQQRSLPRLDGVSFEADAVRVGAARVPCHVEGGGVVVVLGDRLRPVTLGERALALSLGAAGVARALWRLSGGTTTRSRPDEQAIVEAVALYLAGAANSTSLHLSLMVASRSFGDPVAAQALGAAIADDLAAGLASGGPGSPAEAGWTVLRVEEAAAPVEDGADLRDPASVRAELVAALLDRAELPPPPEPADAAPVASAARGVAAPSPTRPVEASAPPARVPTRVPASGPGRLPGPRAGAMAEPALGGAAAPIASASPAPDASPRDPADPVVAPSRFPAWSPTVAAQPTSRVAPGPREGSREGSIASSVVPTAPAPPTAGPGWGPSTAPTSGHQHPISTAIDWRALPTLCPRPDGGLAAPDGGPGGPVTAGRTAGAARAAQPGWPHEDASVDAGSGLSAAMAEQLLAAADRRGLA